MAWPAGVWNVGLAGSVRVSGRFTPYVDAIGPVSYKPGLEGRVRAGVDRLVGQSRLTAGLTWSTFGTDQLSSGALTAGRYQPGPRWIAEASAAVPAGRSRLTLEAWHFQRSSGDSAGQSIANRERLTSVGAGLTAPLGGRLSGRLGLDARAWKQGTTDGLLGAGTAGLGFALSRRLTVAPEVRYERGHLEPASGRSRVTGISFSVFLRSIW
jgi:hypothetical protein